MAGVTRQHTKETSRHRSVFLWLNVRSQPSTGLLSSTRLYYGACVDPSACRPRRNIGAHRPTSTSVSSWIAVVAQRRPYSGEMNCRSLSIAAKSDRASSAWCNVSGYCFDMCTLWPNAVNRCSQSATRALPVRGDDMLAGERAGRKRQEQ